VRLDALGPGRTVLYIYPLTGRPGTDLPQGWDATPGARGCTPETCSFRDQHDDLLAAGATAVFGLSSQDTDYQRLAGKRSRQNGLIGATGPLTDRPQPIRRSAALRASLQLRAGHLA
jgi:hypothetical protein